MKIIKKFLVMFTLLIPAIAYGQSTQNSIYIEQIGDGSTITIDQTGNTNTIGDIVLDIPFDLDGASQTITINQNGNTNSLDGTITGSNITASIDTVGNANDLDFNVGATAAGGSTLDFDVTGDNNDVDFTQGSISSATNADVTVGITGDFNTFNSTIETDDVTNTFAVTGDSNNMTIVQNGQSGKNIDMALTGSTNNVTINQKSTLNVDSINLTSTTSNSTISIDQCDASGC